MDRSDLEAQQQLPPAVQTPGRSTKDRADEHVGEAASQAFSTSPESQQGMKKHLLAAPHHAMHAGADPAL